jgi:hypothetical protein
MRGKTVLITGRELGDRRGGGRDSELAGRGRSWCSTGRNRRRTESSRGASAPSP